MAIKSLLSLRWQARRGEAPARPEGAGRTAQPRRSRGQAFQLKWILKNPIKHQPENVRNARSPAQLYTIVRKTRFCHFSMASKCILKLEFGLKTLHATSFSDHWLTQKNLSHKRLQFQLSDPPNFHVIQCDIYILYIYIIP